ncbi:MAG: glycosyltransferase family 39 protein [Acidobacteria bacterium]|nr:glycosyltransferase family 39 protein [Acidobacteriota bacterium]
MRPLFRPLLYALLIYGLYILGLGRVGLVGPDEPRYADVARGMMRLGDYITPHLYGGPWFEKPPLYYWLAALTFRLGVNELTARLPSAIAAAIFLGFWFWFARRFYGDCAAKFSCLMLATTLGWIGFARAAAMDMLFATTLAAALALLALWLWEERPAGLYGFYALLGVATLAKGPLALALASLVVLSYVIHRRQWNIISRMLKTAAIALYAAIALPWYVLCYWRNGMPFIEEFFFKHNIERLVSATAIGHSQPIWFYLPILAAGLFPWSPTLMLLAWDAWKRGGRRAAESPERVFLIYWVALPFLFFSLSANKLPGYLLPILPPLTLWIGHAISEHYTPESPGNWILRATVAASALLLLCTPLVALLLPEALASGLGGALAQARGTDLVEQILSGSIPVVGWMVLGGLVAFSLILLWRGRTLGGVFAGVIGVAWAVLLLTTYLSPAINRVASVRTVAQRIQSYDVTPGELAVFYLHRNQVYGLGFYLDGLPPEWDPKKPSPSIQYVAARNDIAVDELHPGAHSLSLFPGQRLRLWSLSPQSPLPFAPAGWPPK